jgi:hypothetical protein
MTAPYVPQKQSILDRLAARLFPATQMLDPQAAQHVGRQGLLNIGTNLLQAGGPSAQQQGTLANIGGAIGGVDIPGMTQQALKLQAYRQQQNAEQAAAEVVQRHAPKPGETPEERFGRFSDILSELAAIPGTEGIVGKLSNVLAQLRPQGRDRARYIFKELEEPPGSGKFKVFRVNEDDPTDRMQIGVGREPIGVTQPDATERRAGALHIVGQNAWQTLQTNFSAPDLKDYLLGKIPGGLGQAGLSAKYKAMMRAGADFGRSYLYIVSGATVNPSEAEEWARTNLPQLGDDPALIDAKLQALEVKNQAMEAAAGRAAAPGAPPSAPAGGGQYRPSNPFRPK